MATKIHCETCDKTREYNAAWITVGKTQPSTSLDGGIFYLIGDYCSVDCLFERIRELDPERGRYDT